MIKWIEKFPGKEAAIARARHELLTKEYEKRQRFIKKLKKEQPNFFK